LVAVPRFLFVPGVRGANDGPHDEGVRANGVSWRLLGANNRELGRSAQVYPELASCQRAAMEVRARIAELTTEIRAEQSTGRWHWRLALQGETVAVAGRSYLRLRECRYNLGQFVALAPGTALAESTEVRRGSSARLRGHAMTLPAVQAISPGSMAAT
jgi:hypothetical protein